MGLPAWVSPERGIAVGREVGGRMPRGQGYAESGQMVGGRYQLVGVIGSGGMGTVWRAHDQLLDRPVAAKVLNIVFGQDSEDRNRRERSLREARATARINHPNVVRVYDYVEDDDRLWIVMELVAARSLDAVLDEDGPMAPRDAAAVGVQIARALRTVHDHGVLHRDVKPGNVLIEPDGHAVLTDFGIAALEGTSGLTSTGAIVGSPEFMAPERIESESPGPASDLWSLGVTLCAAVTGKSPFRRATPVATLAAIVIAEPEVPDGTGPLEPLVRALFAREPDMRPSAGEVLAMLEDVLADEARQHTDDPTRAVGARPAAVPTWRMRLKRVASPREAASTADLTMATASGVSGSSTAVPVDDATASLVMPAVRGTPIRHPASGPTESLPRVPAPPQATEVPAAVGELAPPAAGAGVGPPTTPHVPATAPGPRGVPARRPRWRRRAVVVSSAVTITVAAVVGIALALTGDKESDTGNVGKGAATAQSSVPGRGADLPGDPGAGPSGAAPAPEDAAYPPLVPTAEPAGVPLTTADEKRFTWPVPEAWSRAERDQTISYVAPGRNSVLAARTAFQQTDDLLGAWREEESRAPAVLAGYGRILFEERTIRGNPGVVWEYTWTEAGVERHAVLAAFLENGLYVEVDVFSNPAAWDQDHALFQWALHNIRLATRGT
ncbi:protein kinase domain-containing protein [Yinghuangia sp. YIM S09857]|uniref:serine/threonine-protein kinase n=1 Tax=Yinghuangia sp. YIM S09857 TaxID=3436929 RepID=UPI003F52CF45